jgi:hypothetical protein
MARLPNLVVQGCPHPVTQSGNRNVGLLPDAEPCPFYRLYSHAKTTGLLLLVTCKDTETIPKLAGIPQGELRREAVWPIPS